MRGSMPTNEAACASVNSVVSDMNASCHIGFMTIRRPLDAKPFDLKAKTANESAKSGSGTAKSP